MYTLLQEQCIHMTLQPAKRKDQPQSSDRRRAEMLQVISEYLDQVGLINFSFRGAAKAADVSPTTLIRYFNNRDELLDALLEHWMQALVSRTVKASRSEPSNDVIGFYREFVADLGSVLYDSNWTGPWHQLAVLSESPKAPKAMRERYLRAWQSGLDNDVKVLRANGLSPSAAETIGRTFYSCKRGIHRDYCLHQDRKAAQREYECLIFWLESSLQSGRRRK